ncbi:prenyltransferase/squalene oxidase repeat-containing protein [Peptococcaceae bacterium 1198_IL3148]
MKQATNRIAVALICLLLMLVFSVNGALAATVSKVDLTKVETEKAISGSVTYLQKQLQNSAYRGLLSWPLLGLYAAGQPETNQQELITGLSNTDYQRGIIGALASQRDPNNYDGKQLVTAVKASQMANGKFADTITGEGEQLINAHVWAIISLYTAGEAIPNPEKALAWLTAQQNFDGGFSIDTTLTESDIDMTAMAVMAMACLGQDSSYPAIEKALAYLKAQQNSDGSFGLWGSATTEAAAQVVQALIMLGIDPTGEEWTKGGGNPITSMLKFRLPNGAFSHGSEMLPNDMATAQALIALIDYSTGQSIYQKLHLQNSPLNQQPLKKVDTI